MHLPPEVQNLIFRDLTKAELKAARLVCKSFDQAAVPFLFDEIFVTAGYSDLDNANLVASRFGVYVKTITLSSVEYKPMSMEDFRETVEPNTMHLKRTNAHLEHAFEVYCRAQRENLEINQSGELMATLCLVLNKSPNCRKMILSDYGNEDVCPEDLPCPRDVLKEDDLCPFKVCKLSASEHLRFHVRPSSPYRMTPNPFHLAILAMSATESTISELDMIHHGPGISDDGDSLNTDVFGVTARQSYHLTLQLQHLTKLRLRLIDLERQTKAQISCSNNPIAKALSSAVNLESLFIEGGSPFVEHHTQTSMFAFLGACRFPKLTSLILRMMDSKEDELLDFLKTSPCLEHLTIGYCILTVGSWEVLAERIRSALRLKSVMLQCLLLRGSSTGIDNDHRLVENFFLRNGENPFTETAIDLWKEKDYRTRANINKDLRLQKRYEMFH